MDAIKFMTSGAVLLSPETRRQLVTFLRAIGETCADPLLSGAALRWADALTPDVTNDAKTVTDDSV